MLSGRLAKRYQTMVEGDTIDAMLMDSDDQWVLVWDENVNPSHTVLLQPDISQDYSQDAEISRQVRILSKYFRTLNPNVVSMLYIDEGMDFFGPTGHAKYGTIIDRAYRAGRERGLITLMAVQRPACISQLSMSESNVKYLFALGNDEDFKRMYQKGFPENVEKVEQDYCFRLLRNRQVYPKLLTLKV